MSDEPRNTEDRDAPPPGDDDDEISGWAKRRATIQFEARELADELGEAASETRHAIGDRVRDDAGRFRRIADLFRQGAVGLLLSLHLGATAVLSAIVFSESFPYPYMYVLMGLLLWVVFAMRFLALKGRRYAAALRSAVVNLLLTAFWVYVLLDQVASREVVVGALRVRPDVLLIWLVVAMYLSAQAGMVVHGAIDRARRAST